MRRVDDLLRLELCLGDDDISMLDAFQRADDVLLQAVQGISDLITTHGMINVDFADVRTIMSAQGRALMGTGYAKGERRAIEAAQQAINSPLLDDISVEGARGILINFTAGPDVKLREIEQAQASLEHELGRSPEDEEIAAELGIPVRELQEIYSKAAYTSVASLDEIGMGAEDVGPTAPGLDEVDDDMKQVLVQVVRQLPERDQVIISLYYYEGLTLSEIGQVLRVSESRVSQLHTRAALALRGKLASAVAA